MNWIIKVKTKFVEKVKQTFKRDRPPKTDIANSAWINCPGCNQMKLRDDLKKVFCIKHAPEENIQNFVQANSKWIKSHKFYFSTIKESSWI